MHNLYFVSIPREEVTTSAEAREYAVNFLDENGFADESGLYKNPRADWYEVGGRWSGLYTKLQDWWKDYEKEVNDMVAAKYKALTSGIVGVHYGNKRAQTQQQKAIAEANAIFKKYCTTVSNPLERCGTFSWDGVSHYDSDDAFIMTAELFEKIKKEEGEVFVAITENCDEENIGFIETEDAVGRWFVVIDYHC